MKKLLITLLLTLPAELFAADLFAAPIPTLLPLCNPTTNQTAIWQLNNNVAAGGVYGPTLPAGWYLMNVYTLNLGPGSIYHYLLYNPLTGQTAIWNMDINYHKTSGQYGPAMPPGFVVHSYFRDDNPFDVSSLLAWNPSNGQTKRIWFSNTTITSSTNYPTLPKGWTLISPNGDFNHDGKPDFLLYNPSTRQTAMWYLNGSAVGGAAYGPTLPSGWTLDDLADFNADGNPDYLLSLNRTTAMWYLTGNILLGGAYGPTIPAGWGQCNAIKPCYISISPASAHYPQGGGGPANIYVSTLQFGCVWNAIPAAIINGARVNYPWIHIINHATWVGSGYTTYTVDANTTPGTRTGYISITTKDGGKLVTITQDGPYSPGWSGTWTGTISGNWYYDESYTSCTVPATSPFTITITSEFDVEGTGVVSAAPTIDFSTCTQTGTHSYSDTLGGSYFDNQILFNMSAIYFLSGTRNGNTITGTVSGIIKDGTGTFTLTKQ